MRVGVYCPQYEDAGGVQLIVQQLNRRMEEAGHALTVVTRLPREPGRTLPDVDPASGVPIVRSRFVPAPYPGLGAKHWRRFVRGFPAGARRLVRTLRDTAPDLVASHASKFYAPYVLAVRAFVRVPIVVHLHNGPRTADGPESRPLMRLLLACASRVVACSPAVADYARACLPRARDRVVAIPYGVDHAAFGAAVAPHPHPRPYVLGMGALAERKGFDLLVDAVAASGLEIDLLLAGDGPQRAALAARAADRGIAKRTHFLGHVDRATVARLLRGAAVVAVPSRFEGHPLIVLETMAAGAPMVVTALPGLPEQVRDGETALVVPLEDAGALAAALRVLVDDPARRRALGAAAAAAARDLPTWATMADRVVAEYACALRRGRRPSPSAEMTAAGAGRRP